MASTVKAPSAKTASSKTRRLFSKRERMLEVKFYHYGYNYEHPPNDCFLWKATKALRNTRMSDSFHDSCNAPLHPRAAEGLRLFNAREYFEAHEALEDAWNAERGRIRDLYRGILQIAVVYLHVTRRN